MKDQKGGGKQRKRSAQRHGVSSSGSRKGKTKQSKTLAEKSGLAGRDTVRTAPQEALELAARSPLGILDLQFKLWSVALRLSPLPHILRQQAEMTRLLFDVWLPESGVQEKRGSRKGRGA